MSEVSELIQKLYDQEEELEFSETSFEISSNWHVVDGSVKKVYYASGGKYKTNLMLDGFTSYAEAEQYLKSHLEYLISEGESNG